ncbi:hypothetical protein [Dyella sp. 2RAB6]|uniref:hypothetical protein n=1 Tax=Dyella sp. 2RAB6 TaxID=3232992 RepID=UPI003F9336A5
MANADNKQPRRHVAVDSSSHQAAQKAQRERDPEQGAPNGSPDDESVSVPARQLPREDEDEDESGSNGDDGEHAAASSMPERAIAPEGGVGHRSGTGQAKTHRSFDQSEGRQMLGQVVDPESELPEPRVGDSYQSGIRVRSWRGK